MGLRNPVGATPQKDQVKRWRSHLRPNLRPSDATRHSCNSPLPFTHTPVSSMFHSQCARSFAADIPVAIDLGGRKAFIRALNLTLRKCGEFKPISTHKAIRKEQALRANWARQNSQTRSFQFPNEVHKGLYHEWGEVCDQPERSKPSAQMFTMLSNGMRRRKVSPFSEKGKRLILESRQDHRSHLKVGVDGWWRNEHTGEIEDVRFVTQNRTANTRQPARSTRGRGRRNRRNRQNNRQRNGYDPRQPIQATGFVNTHFGMPLRTRGWPRRRGRRNRGRGAGRGRGNERTPGFIETLDNLNHRFLPWESVDPRIVVKLSVIAIHETYSLCPHNLTE